MGRIRRCAVYTRKSTEEGLEQDFNSLDAQREACEAYIKSQAGEGWRLIRTQYNDGGISGGTMERPALQRLLGDISAGKVDAIVVYKVDRLTRSLSDFAKIVEVFDEKDVSFVSVTQSFNTTTSMGRLTLNMLLSFAQFEREVTGERIRDKIAASRRKGMWMGGVVPLGYDAIDRKLIVNQPEADTVRTLFRLYLKHKNVRLVKAEADVQGLRTKSRVFNNAKRQGGGPFSSGHIYALLSNPLYIGETVHKGIRYPGEHAAIIDTVVWDAVQAQLKQNTVNRRHGTNAKKLSLLGGLLRDDQGRPMVASHASKSGKRYRYYISRRTDGAESSAMWRLPAPTLETVVVDGIAAFLENRLRLTDALHLVGEDLQRHWAAASRLAQNLRGSKPSRQRSLTLKLIAGIIVQTNRLDIDLRVPILLEMLAHRNAGDATPAKDEETFTLQLPLAIKRRGVELKLVVTDGQAQAPAPDPHLIRAIAQGRQWFTQLRDGEVPSVLHLAESLGVNQGDVSRILPLGLLAPDIVEAILTGLQPVDLTTRRLKRLTDLPVAWIEQRRVLGFA